MIDLLKKYINSTLKNRNPEMDKPSKSIQCNPFLTTAQIVTTVAIATDFSFISVIQFTSAKILKSLSSVTTTTRFESLGVKQKEMQFNFTREKDPKHFPSQPPPHKHSLMVPYTFIGLASSINITQGMGSTEVCV